MQTEPHFSAQEELKTVALLMAHDLRGVLAVLNSLAILMEHKPDGRHVDMMKQQLDVCDRLVEHFVQFVEGKAKPKRVSLAALVTEAAGTIVLPANIRIETSVSFDGQVMAEPQQVLQVLLNLLNNARKACGDSTTTIRVSVRREDAYARVDVEDTGSGVPRDYHLQLLHQRIPATQGGLGWGLSLCRQIIDNAGGRMTFLSEPGCGATFSFWLPIAEG